MTLDYAMARANMVDSQVRTNDVTDLGVQDAMAAIARERFCLPGFQHLAYAEAAVPYGGGLTLMEPRDLSKTLQGIFPVRGEKALAIAAPYAAAVLARIGLEVTLVAPPGEAADTCSRALEGLGVTLAPGDLKRAGEGSGPFDVVVCEGAVPRPPAAWLEAVGIGGRLGLAERSGPVTRGVLYTRGRDGLLARRPMFDATTALMAGFEEEAAFVF